MQEDNAALSQMTTTSTHNIDNSYLRKWKENQFHLSVFTRLTQKRSKTQFFYFFFSTRDF